MLYVYGGMHSITMLVCTSTYQLSPITVQTLIQGGCLIFHGRTPVLVRLDKGTADHIDFDEAIALATK